MGQLSITAVDVVVVAVVLISAFLAMWRGFVSEVFTIFEWVAAAYAALRFTPTFQPLLKSVISPPWLEYIVVFVGTFLIVIIPLSIMAHRLSEMIKRSEIGPVDRSMGFVFGMARGLVIIGLAYIAFAALVPQPDRPAEKQVFCAGADLKNAVRRNERDDPGSDNYKFWQTQEGLLLNRGLEVWKPVVAAVNGLCLAGGMTLLLATDIRIASEHAMFDLSEVKRGILPGNGGTHRTIRQLPYAIAMEMLLLAKRLTAERAAHFGLINEVVPHDKVMEVAMARARELASMAPLATRAIKELAVRGQYMELNESLRMEHMMADKLHNTEDGKEGPRAFVEKRKANFQGR